MDAKLTKQYFRVQDNEGNASTREDALVPILSSVQVKVPINKFHVLINYLKKFNEKKIIQFIFIRIYFIFW